MSLSLFLSLSLSVYLYISFFIFKDLETTVVSVRRTMRVIPRYRKLVRSIISHKSHEKLISYHFLEENIKEIHFYLRINYNYKLDWEKHDKIYSTMLFLERDEHSFTRVESTITKAPFTSNFPAKINENTKIVFFGVEMIGLS